jgi:poly-gamma-glutamate synthesis protein (capsule biosynthesis protein)
MLHFFQYGFYAGCFLLTGCATDSVPSPNGISTASQPSISQQPTAAKTVFKLSFVGDIMGHGDQIKAAYDPKTKTYDYEPCFRYVRPLLEQSDLAIGNLEVTLSNKNNYTGYPRFRSPDVLAGYTQKGGFDMLVTANNHSNDGDLYGVVHTLDILDSLKILHTGTFRDSAERAKTYPFLHTIQKNGVSLKIAFLNYSYGTNGIETKKPSIVNLIDSAQMVADIQKAKAMNPDIMIALIHWGSEYKLNESSEQQKVCKLLYAQGVPLVIGAHPHVIQPIKTDTILDSTKTPTYRLCAYSLGNFISNQNQKNTDIGLIVEVNIEKSADAQPAKVLNHAYIPCWRYIYNKSAALAERVYTIIPVSGFEQDTTNFLLLSQTEKASMLSITKAMRTHLNKWGGVERIIQFSEVVDKNTQKPNK